MRILLTGAAGFIGSHLSDRLLADGHDVIGVDNLSTGRLSNLNQARRSARFRFIAHDVIEPLRLDEPLNWVMHFASPASPPKYLHAPVETLRVNAEGTRHLLELAQRQGAEFFLASTSEVYGDPLVHPQPEGYWGNVNSVGPRSVYDESKRYAESLTTAFAETHGVPVRIIRIFNTYGPRMDPGDGRVVTNLIVQALRGEPLTVYGTGEQTRSFQYVDDLVDGIVALMGVPHTQPVNLGNPEEYTIRQFAELVRELTGSSASIKHQPLPVDDPRQRKPDISKAQSLLNWTPRVPVREGLRRTIDHVGSVLPRSSDEVQGRVVAQEQETVSSPMSTNVQLDTLTESGPELARPVARGKFIWVGSEKLWVRGVTYGAFRPDEQKREYQDVATIERDFAQMAAAGFNAVRIPHTMPPRHLLDMAARHGLRVMVGLSAEQYAGYLADPKKDAPNIDELVREKVRAVAGQPALLCYALGNEIPASMVRWLGRRKVERYLERLYKVVKAEDPEGLVTYVNYPSTEYLQLPFLDFVAFNVYLESPERLDAYLARLQNIAGDRPLLMSELGLDAQRNSEAKQAEVLDWQIRTTFAAGCAGAFVFSWTDEWYRGGADVDDWAFGVTDRERRPKPALAALQSAFTEAPFPRDRKWPRMSVVVCVYNGERTLRDCCDSLKELDYPDYEVIIVDDGSKDNTAAIVAEYPFRVIRTPNQGLSQARNVGLEAATGEIVAYTDGDARPDPHWLSYLADEFQATSHVGIGGWNTAPEGDGWFAGCVANAPGGPVHVLLSDREAEHIPGCSMAFRADALKAIGGFDPQFRAAGDDVDVCWRLQDQGWTLGFSHGAMVWHHNRDSFAAYWRQQRGYGQAEAMLERKWPDKYNVAGHLTWVGRLYGRGLALPIGRTGRVYQGTWGLAPFQTLVDGEPGLLRSLPLMPEWHLMIATLGVVSLIGLAWTPLLIAVPLFLLALAAPAVQAWTSTENLSPDGAHSGRGRARTRITVAALHLLQPLARLRGRLKYGLTVWRKRGPDGLSWPVPRTLPILVTQWQPPEARLAALAEALQNTGAVVLHGNRYDSWDLEVRGGLFGSSRMLMAFEDSGSGTQLVRLRAWPYCSPLSLVPIAFFLSFAALAAFNGAQSPGFCLGFSGPSSLGEPP